MSGATPFWCHHCDRKRPYKEMSYSVRYPACYPICDSCVWCIDQSDYEDRRLGCKSDVR